MMKDKNYTINTQDISAMQDQIGGKADVTPKSKNQIEYMQDEIDKQRILLAEQANELLGLYRRLLGRDQY